MKLRCVIYAPFDTRSGYGAHSRDLIKSIIESKKEEWDIKLMSCPWGKTSQGFISNNKEWKFLIDYLLPTPNLQYQPDIWIMITVPNEFQPLGKYNIGVTAGIETNICDPSWIEGINRMNLTLVSSHHAKNVFINSQFEKKDNNGNLVETIKAKKPIEVLFEGVDINLYKPLDKSSFNLDIEEDFAYLFVGHWLPGDLGEDRKNVGLLIKSFYETFKNKQKCPALVLKTNILGNSSYIDRDLILDRINKIKQTVVANSLPNIYLVHGDITDQDMNQLYNHPKIKALISLTKGEGFGRPLLEFSLTKKPIIVSGWGGHIDFLNPEFNRFLPGHLRPIHDSAVVDKMLIKNSQWFSPDLGNIHDAYKDIYENYKKWKELATRQAYISRTKFSYEKMKEELNVLLNTHLPEFPKPIKLVIPELDKIRLPKKEING